MATDKNTAAPSPHSPDAVADTSIAYSDEVKSLADFRRWLMNRHQPPFAGTDTIGWLDPEQVLEKFDAAVADVPQTQVTGGAIAWSYEQTEYGDRSYEAGWHKKVSFEKPSWGGDAKSPFRNIVPMYPVPDTNNLLEKAAEALDALADRSGDVTSGAYKYAAKTVRAITSHSTGNSDV